MIELNGVRDALAALTEHPPRFYRAPGRVTLVGAHVSDSEGFVLPVAIDRVTVCAAAPRSDRALRVRRHGNDEIAHYALDDLDPAPRAGWADGIRRAAVALHARGRTLRGADIAVRSTLPPRKGLAAAASCRLAATLALAGCSDDGIALDEIVEVCRSADDALAPIVVAHAKRDHALLVDCRSGEASPVPLTLADTALVICDAPSAPDAAAVRRERRAECEEAARLLRPYLKRVATLRDVSLADFLRLGDRLPPTLRRRTRHVVTENVRVLQAVAAARAEDAATIGNRMNESHDSLRDDYDVGTSEDDVLVAAARTVPGVFGSRMTGSGGATVSLVRRSALPAFRGAVSAAYRSAFGRHITLLEVRTADGASLIG